MVTFDRNDRSLADRLASEYLRPEPGAVDPLVAGTRCWRRQVLHLPPADRLQAAAFLGSVAAAIEAQEVGNRPVDVERVLSYVHQRDALPRGAAGVVGRE